jgi:hypothetical protein
MARWLAEQQDELIRQHGEVRAREEAARARARELDGSPAQAIPLPDGGRIDRVQISPDGGYLAVRWTRPNPQREGVVYADYAHESGYTQAPRARAKVGEPRDEAGMGIVRIDPRLPPDEVEMIEVHLPEAGDLPTVIHGPWWSLEGDRAAVQLLSRDHKNLWIGILDPATGEVALLDHQHDPAWIGGPPIQGGSLQPTLLEWLPGGDRFVFASERTGWSHLYLAEPDGTVRPLTEGGVGGARRRAQPRPLASWLLQRQPRAPLRRPPLHSCPPPGGELVRLTDARGPPRGRALPGRRARLASVLLRAPTVQLPDLFLTRPGARRRGEARVTVSGLRATFHAHRVGAAGDRLLPAPRRRPGLGRAVPAGASRTRSGRRCCTSTAAATASSRTAAGPSTGTPTTSASSTTCVQQGYTVLDFDYRGSSGFGRDYRTDIYRSMGVKDVDGAVAAVDYLAREHDVDPRRVGLYGVSYGGFFTLMALFRYPGVFAAGVANDGGHRLGALQRRLDQPHPEPAVQDEEAYRVSSPIYHAGGAARTRSSSSTASWTTTSTSRTRSAWSSG